jgi:hypothetical protein
MKTFNFTSDAPAPPGAIREIAFYDSIHDLPMFRLNEFQIHLSQDAGIGSTVMDWDKRMAGVDEFLAAGDLKNAIRERYNSRLGIFLMLEGISTTARCLADLVYSVDGEPISDFSDSGLLEIHKRIMERMSIAQVSELLDTLKKKFKRELRVAFPTLFPDDDEVAFFAKLVRRAILQVEDIKEDAETANPEIAQIEDWLRNESKPENFDFSNPENAVDERRRAFETVCAALAMNNVPGAEYLTAYKFHARILYISSHKGPAPQSEAYANSPQL